MLPDLVAHRELRLGWSVAASQAQHLSLDPLMGFLQTHAQRLSRLPAQRFAYQLVVGITSAHAERAGNMLDLEPLAGDRNWAILGRCSDCGPERTWDHMQLSSVTT